MTSTDVTLRVWRGDAGQGALTEYQVLANEGEVVLDILHRLQATQAADLAVSRFVKRPAIVAALETDEYTFLSNATLPSASTRAVRR